MITKTLKQILTGTIFSVGLILSVNVQAFATTDLNKEVVPITKTSKVTFDVYYGTTIRVNNLEELKSQIEICLKAKKPTISLKYTGTDIRKWSETICASIDEVLLRPSNDYEKYTMKGYSFSYNSIGDIKIDFSYMETASESALVTSKVKEIVSNIIKPNMTEAEKEKAINNYIVANVSYDTSLSKYSAYAAVVAPYKTVCQGYALLAYKMLKEAGLEARIISGYADGVGHAWNLVKVNGKWYHLDTTWNDPIPDVAGRVRYDYFNLQDSEISDSSRKHTWDKSKYIGYECITPYTMNRITGVIPSTSSNVGSNINLNNIATFNENNILITNNIGNEYKIKVRGLTSRDLVRIYDGPDSRGRLIGYGLVASGKSEATLYIPQLGKKSGKVYLTVTSYGEREGSKIEKSFQEDK